MFKKCIFILATSCMMYSCATKTESNPFFTEFQTEYGVPSFDKIKLELSKRYRRTESKYRSHHRKPGNSDIRKYDCGFG